jgi:hypothetical protein
MSASVCDDVTTDDCLTGTVASVVRAGREAGACRTLGWPSAGGKPGKRAACRLEMEEKAAWQVHVRHPARQALARLSL